MDLSSYCSRVRNPTSGDKVYKDECCFTFDTPSSPGGLYVSLSSFRAYGSDLVGASPATGGIPSGVAPEGLYLHIATKKVPKPMTKEEGEAAAEVTKVAIGVDGGFQSDDTKWDTETAHALVAVLPGGELSTPVPLTDVDAIPMSISAAAAAVIARTDAGLETAAAWQEGPIMVSKFAEALVQDDPVGKMVSSDPKEWKCEKSGNRENLWLNLTTGYIGSGRRFFDGSGGTGAAEDHYKEMKALGKNCPLVVKLGTITPKGADIFSYDPSEDDMVLDPKLSEHLAHWGINIMNLEKTEKTTAEINIEMNQNFNFMASTEGGLDLVSCFAPGRIGLMNLGNSCYIASLVQVLFSLPEFRRFIDGAGERLGAAARDPAIRPEDDLALQLCKLGIGVGTDRYLVQSDIVRSELIERGPPAGEDPEKFNARIRGEEIAVAPSSFKALVGKGHADFSTSLQQDATDFMRHMLSLFENVPNKEDDMSKLFSYEVEERFVMTSGPNAGKVKYSTIAESILGLSIPLDAVDNREEVAAAEAAAAVAEPSEKRQKVEAVAPNIPWSAVLGHYLAPTEVGIQSGTAEMTTRFARFPKYLMVQLRRYTLTKTWEPIKLEHTVHMPDTIDTVPLQGHGLQPSETEIDEDSELNVVAGSSKPKQTAAVTMEPDDTIVMQIVSMGFTENAAKRAALATSNTGADPAMNWVLEHMEDANLNDPVTPAETSSNSATVSAVDEAAVAMISSMGFSPEHAAFALTQVSGADAAVMWLFENTDKVDSLIAAKAAADSATPSMDVSGAPANELETRVPKQYRLKAMISHIGKYIDFGDAPQQNTGSGHYVCHVKNPEGKWIIFNDRKVCWSVKTPLEHGYMYLYAAEY